MDGTRNQLLASPSLTQDKDRGIGGGDGCHLLQRHFERCALANDLLKIDFAANFIFKIELFMRELLFELANLAIGQRILNGNGDLCAELAEKDNFFLSERLFLASPEPQVSKDSAAMNHRNNAAAQYSRSEERRVGKECRSRWSTYH